MDDIMDQYFTIGTRSQGGKIPIKHVMDRPLMNVLFTIEKVVSSRISYQTMWSHMLYALEHIWIRLYSIGVRDSWSLKDQLLRF